MEVSKKVRNQLLFFGLTPEIAPQARVALFKQIHEIIFHGKGGYDYQTVYNLPIWLRKYTFSEIRKWYEEEKAAMENQTSPGNKNMVNPDGTVNTPAFLKESQPYKGKSSYK